MSLSSHLVLSQQEEELLFRLLPLSKAPRHTLLPVHDLPIPQVHVSPHPLTDLLVSERKEKGKERAKEREKKKGREAREREAREGKV